MDDFVLPVIPTANYKPKTETTTAAAAIKHTDDDQKQQQITVKSEPQQSNTTATAADDDDLQPLEGESRRAAKRRRKAEQEAQEAKVAKLKPQTTIKQQPLASDDTSAAATVRRVAKTQHKLGEKLNLASQAAVNAVPIDDADSGEPLTRAAKRRKLHGNPELHPKAQAAAAATTATARPQSTTPRRFIVFVGQIGWRTKLSDIEEFFAAMHPVAIRFPTDPKTQKPKGYAFVEFETSEQLRRALLLHHCELAGRRINVELTAGGGGAQSEVRKEKLQKKNEALTQERKERQQQMQKEKEEEQQMQQEYDQQQVD